VVARSILEAAGERENSCENTRMFFFLKANDGERRGLGQSIQYLGTFIGHALLLQRKV